MTTRFTCRRLPSRHTRSFLLVGDIGAVASLIQRPRNGVFGIVVDYGYIPAGAGHASGAVNAF